MGTPRAAIAVRTADYFFVGPDNGVLSLALATEKILEIRRLENQIYFRQPVSDTFHGRDVFAPVAARLMQGILLDSLGPQVSDYVRLPWSPSRFVEGVLTGTVVYIDHFGNAITNLDGAVLAPLAGRLAIVSVRGVETCELKKCYQDVPAGQPVAVIGSSGFMEIAINSGSAAQKLGLKLGDPIAVR